MNFPITYESRVGLYLLRVKGQRLRWYIERQQAARVLMRFARRFAGEL